MKISIKKILEEMPEDLTDIEKVRYIYLKIGNIFSYNREYLHAKDYRVINDMYNDIITINMIENGDYQNKIFSTCKQTAELESDTINLLKNKHINARTVGYDEIQRKHVAVIVTIDDKNYYLDINPDFYKIQKGMRTVGFAKSDEALDGTKCETISDEELERIDKKIGYCKCGMYMDEVIEMLRNEMSDDNNLEEYMQEYDMEKDESKEDAIYRYKIDFIFKYLKNNLLEKDKMGIKEIEKYYDALFRRILTKEEKINNKKITFDIYLKDEQQTQQESILYQIVMKNKKIYYIYKEKERGFVKVDEEEVKKMEVDGELEYLDKYFKPKFDKEESR